MIIGYITPQNTELPYRGAKRRRWAPSAERQLGVGTVTTVRYLDEGKVFG